MTSVHLHDLVIVFSFEYNVLFGKPLEWWIKSVKGLSTTIHFLLAQDKFDCRNSERMTTAAPSDLAELLEFRKAPEDLVFDLFKSPERDEASIGRLICVGSFPLFWGRK